MESQTNQGGGQTSWIKIWLPVLIGTALIASSSSSLFSSEHTNGPFRWLYELFSGPVSDARWHIVHFYMRKSGHFFGYGVFGLLWLRAWWFSLPHSRFFVDAALAVLGCGMVASADEFHQAFLPSRTGSPWDVLLDCSGAITLQLAVYLFMRIFKPKKLARAA
ncbi:MAG: VanZ family protein [Acidobacteriota bacterium]|nr:VanZ family protein [Acidobacteriota bacterium]